MGNEHANERAMILQMVESGKVSVDDAVKLLDAIKLDQAQNDRQKLFDTIELDERINRFARTCDNIARDISDKVSDTWRGVQPKVKSATKAAMEKTISAIDKLSQSLNESLKCLDEEAEGCQCGCEGCDPPRDNGPAPHTETEGEDDQA